MKRTGNCKSYYNSLVVCSSRDAMFPDTNISHVDVCYHGHDSNSDRKLRDTVCESVCVQKETFELNSEKACQVK